MNFVLLRRTPQENTVRTSLTGMIAWMLRRLFPAASVLSLLLCAAIAALWVRSCFVWDELAREDASPLRFNPNYDRNRPHPAKYLIDHSSVTVADSFHGFIWLRWYVDHGPTETDGRWPPRRGWQWIAAAPGRWGTKPYPWGPYGLSRFQADPQSQFNVLVSDWALCLGTGILPTIWLIGFKRHRRKRRQAAGQCQCCGYDLRTSTDRCPECGTPISVKQKSAAASD